MIPFILSELEDWRSEYGKLALGLLAIGLTIALFFSRFQLLIFFFTLIAWFIWLGWMGANRGWHRRNAWKWIAHQGLSARSWVVGKMLAYLVIAFFHLAVMLPPLILVTSTWGLPLPELVLILGIAMSAGCMVVALSLFTGGNEGISGDLLNIVIIGFWLAVGFLVEAVRLLCPFYLVWDLVESLNAGPALYCLLLNLGIVAALLILAGLFLGKTIRRSP